MARTALGGEYQQRCTSHFTPTSGTTKCLVGATVSSVATRVSTITAHGGHHHHHHETVGGNEKNGRLDHVASRGWIEKTYTGRICGELSSSRHGEQTFVRDPIFQSVSGGSIEMGGTKSTGIHFTARLSNDH